MISYFLLVMMYYGGKFKIIMLAFEGSHAVK